MLPVSSEHTNAQCEDGDRKAKHPGLQLGHRPDEWRAVLLQL